MQEILNKFAGVSSAARSGRRATLPRMVLALIALGAVVSTTVAPVGAQILPDPVAQAEEEDFVLSVDGHGWGHGRGLGLSLIHISEPTRPY